jgi:hypothetical protein
MKRMHLFLRVILMTISYLYCSDLHALSQSHHKMLTTRETVINALSGDWISQGIYTVSKLKIADHLDGAGMDIASLAAVTNANPDGLRALMRSMVRLGLFKIQSGKFVNNKMSSLLKSDNPWNFRDLSIFYHEEIGAALDDLEGFIRSGSLVLNKVYYHDIERDLRLHHYNFGQLCSEYNAGAKAGALLNTLFKKYGSLRQTMKNLPEVIEAKEEQKMAEDMFRYIAGKWIAKGYHLAVVWDIPGKIENGNDLNVMAMDLGCTPKALYPFMRLLKRLQIVEEPKPKTFKNTEIGQHLTKDHPYSIRDMILFYADEVAPVSSNLFSMICGDEESFSLSPSKLTDLYFGSSKKAEDLTSIALEEKMIVPFLLENFDFTPYTTIIDLGGGSGLFMSEVCKKSDEIKGIVLELPEVVERINKIRTQLHPRCQIITGDFFEKVPSRGDLYVLKTILSEWDDEKALQILNNCFQAMPDKAKLLVIDLTNFKGKGSDFSNSLDLLKFVAKGYPQRSLGEYKKLLKESGFKINKTTETGTEFVVIEVSKT